MSSITTLYIQNQHESISHQGSFCFFVTVHGYTKNHHEVHEEHEVFFVFLLSQLQNCSLAALGWEGSMKNTGNIVSSTQPRATVLHFRIVLQLALFSCFCFVCHSRARGNPFFCFCLSFPRRRESIFLFLFFKKSVVIRVHPWFAVSVFSFVSCPALQEYSPGGTMRA